MDICYSVYSTFDYGKEYSTEQGYIVQYDRLPMAPETELDILFQAKRYGQVAMLRIDFYAFANDSIGTRGEMVLASVGFIE